VGTADADRPAAEEERESESRAVDRLTFFSDAVVAIAITLLAIDLPVPEGSTVAAFWASARDQDGQYAAFLISFFVIAAAWGGHHDFFRYIRSTDARLRSLNMAWLLTIILNPFATRMLTPGESLPLDVHALRYGFYALLLFAQSAVLLAMVRQVITREQATRTSGPALAGIIRQCYVLVAGFALSIPLFFVTPFAWVLWIITPTLAARAARAARGHRRKPAGASRAGGDGASGGPAPG
jgi:uncharacterized membrane protein